MAGKKWRLALSWTVIFLALVLALTGAIWATSTEQTLFVFRNGNGATPYSRLISDKAGNLYGTTYFGGIYLRGSVFELERLKDGWKPNLLYSFRWIGGEGTNPYAGLTFDKAGSLYGTTQNGGANGMGMVFKLTPSHGHWTETAIYSFKGGLDGAFPDGDLVFDKAGNLYGTTVIGGNNVCIGQGCGTVFKLTPVKGGWKETVLYNFAGGTDGFAPVAGVIVGNAGNIYGTTTRGGSETCSQSCGTVFELKHSKGRWTETVLYSFSGSTDGGTPYAGVIFDKMGNLYGTTYDGGAGLSGAVFELVHSNGNWTEAVIYSLTGGFDGSAPQGGLIFDKMGNLYGTSSRGGSQGGGAVFELTSSSTGWTAAVLHQFDGSDGASPAARLWLDAAGNLFGTTSSGGGSHECEQGCGVVFEVTP